MRERDRERENKQRMNNMHRFVIRLNYLRRRRRWTSQDIGEVLKAKHTQTHTHSQMPNEINKEKKIRKKKK